jgi:hypothetical protein
MAYMKHGRRSRHLVQEERHQLRGPYTFEGDADRVGQHREFHRIDAGGVRHTPFRSHQHGVNVAQSIG